MGISKIGTLFAANVDALSPRSASTQSQTSSSGAGSNSSGEAVVFSSSFNSSVQENDPGRDQRLADIQSRVKSGNYQVDSSKVAIAVFRDLA